MDETKDLLFEIGCAELPSKGLNELSIKLTESIKNELDQAELKFGNVETFVTPRRLAVLIHNLNVRQPDRQIEKRGPAVTAPQAAKEGFARSCQVNIDQLQELETPQGSWLVYRFTESGKNTIEILPQLIQQGLGKLTLTKKMRWGKGEITFIRPVQWLVLLFGDEIVNTEIFGVKTGRQTIGHRFHHPDSITINSPSDYEMILEKEGKVIANFGKRKEIIFKQVTKLAQDKSCKSVINPDLLEEVTGIVEWPVSLLCSYDQRYIKLPQEVLICSMQHHQKCFPLVGNDNLIKPYFITVSNIESKDVAQVIAGNTRVVQARLADAEFFYETDHKRQLSDYVEDLKHVIFQHKLGSSYEKSQRIARLAKLIAGKLKTDEALAEQAGLLCKADLMTNMVGEFPELQGIMGYYYAKRENHETTKNKAEFEKNNPIAIAIRDHYLPRFSGDQLPSSHIACAVTLADRFDTLVGLFGINQPPTGEKDPFGLRRAAIAILRIIIEKKLDINLFELNEWAVRGYSDLPNEKAAEQVHEFILERLRALYAEQAILPDTLAAVIAVQNLYPLDIDYRMRAVQAFRQLPEAGALAFANKRATNILEKSEVDKAIFANNAFNKINPFLFKKAEERSLYEMILKKNISQNKHAQNQARLMPFKLTLTKQEETEFRKAGLSLHEMFLKKNTSQTEITQNQANLMPLNLKLTEQEYTKLLHSFTELYKPVNEFFDAVMVNVEDENIRNNRLLLVAALRELFLQVADISLLQISV